MPYLCITQGDKGEIGLQGPQGPMVCVLFKLLKSFCYTIKHIQCVYICQSFLLQGYPGEKGATGSSDIIDFNGKLLDAFQVSDIKCD